MDLQCNADRFRGFAAVYDDARPPVPHRCVELLTRYLEKTPDTVVDLGSGTGLSTRAWQGSCREAIGVEPSPDMIAQARLRGGQGLRFVEDYAHCTGLPDKCADIVVCSQSFHWMEPVSTLNEVDRILAPGGLFAAVDCDWPAVYSVEVEMAYRDLFDKVRTLESALPGVRDSFRRFDKSHHLENIRACGHFRYTRELVLMNEEPFTPERYIGLAMSQGSLQTILKQHPETIQPDLDRFCERIQKNWIPGRDTAAFCYRIRIGFKAPAQT